MHWLRVLTAAVFCAGIGVVVGSVILQFNVPGAGPVLTSLLGFALIVVGALGWLVVVLWPSIVEARKRGTNQIVVGDRHRRFHDALRSSGDSAAPAWKDLDVGVQVPYRGPGGLFPSRGKSAPFIFFAYVGIIAVSIWAVVYPYRTVVNVSLAVITMLVLVGGVAVLVLARLGLRRTKQMVARLEIAASVPGRDAEVIDVQDHGVSEHNGAPVWRVTVRYTDHQGVARRHVENTEGIAPTIGSIHTVKYDPSHPDRRLTTFLLRRDLPSSGCE